MKYPVRYFWLMGLFLLTFCSNGKKNSQSQAEQPMLNLTNIPEFNADSAYRYISAQVAFGPRVPNTDAHRECADYLSEKLKAFGAKVTRQQAEVTAFDGTLLHITNIVGSYQPELPHRILLCSHWDSRPFADQDKEENYRRPIDGANDGASGVGVLLEIARQLQTKSPEVGIDIIFFDAEDYGTPHFYTGNDTEDSWCLGTQYWGRIPHVPDYKARYGILLDMVGGNNATFYYERYSSRTASAPMHKIWDVAKSIGKENYFRQELGGEITDDHVYVHRLRQIPCVDIIDYNPYSETGFNPTWHTLNDNLEHISKSTLQAVGQVVLTVIYNEKAN